MDKMGLTQTELSKLTGIPQPTISKWKNTGKTPGNGSLRKIIKGTGCNLEWLKYGVEPMFTGAGNLEKGAEIVRAKEQDLFVEFIKEGFSDLFDLIISYASPEEIKELYVTLSGRKEMFEKAILDARQNNDMDKLGQLTLNDIRRRSAILEYARSKKAETVNRPETKD